MCYAINKMSTQPAQMKNHLRNDTLNIMGINLCCVFHTENKVKLSVYYG